MSNILDYEPEFEADNNRFHLVMDPDYRFLDNNHDIDRWVIDKSMLIDAGNKIKLIGPPFAFNRMAELLYTICRK